MYFQEILFVFSLLSKIGTTSCFSLTNMTTFLDSDIGERSVTISGAVQNSDSQNSDDNTEEEAVVIQPVDRHLGSFVCVNQTEYYQRSQRFALVQLFYKMNIIEYLPGGNNDDKEVCGWKGVTCNTDKLVIGWRLDVYSGLEFREDIEIKTGDDTDLSELSLLENLEVIDFSNQVDLRGKLPNLKNLKNLRSLDISYTRINGKASRSGICPNDENPRVITYTPTMVQGFDCDCSKNANKVCEVKVMEFPRPPPKRPGNDDD